MDLLESNVDLLICLVDLVIHLLGCELPMVEFVLLERLLELTVTQR